MSFAHSQGFQIHGGNFYNVAGGLSIKCQLPLDITSDPAHSARVQGDWSLDGTTAPNLVGLLHPPTSGVQKSAQNRSGVRHHPYSVSESLEKTLISACEPMNTWNLQTYVPSRNIHHRGIPRHPTGTEYLLNSVADERFRSASLLGLGYNSTEPWPSQGTHEASAFLTIRGPEDQLFESLPSGGDFDSQWRPGPSTTINGGTFVNNNIQRQGDRGIDLLHGAVALAAIYDSAESFPQPKCHPETRTEMLEDLREWVLETDPGSTILWLHGPAGAGKSAIMQTLARELQKAGTLGGSFFFKRGHATRGNGKTLFATIAYQLALGVPWLKAPISNIVEDDPSIIVRSIEVQLQKLIFQPCCLDNVGETRDPIAILIDGLDECEGKDVQEEILRSIRNSVADFSLPLHFIIASRPEPHICEMFESPFYAGLYRAFNVDQSFDDVKKYLRDEFARIRREHHRTMANISPPWPSPQILDHLVWKSSGHFIYASTIIKFVDDKNYRPTDRLATVEDQDVAQSCSVFDPLDQLYMTILYSAPLQDQLVPILCAITNFQLHPDAVDELCGLAPGDTRLLLRGLHSVLGVPEGSDDTISIHHASFRDFLRNERRSQQFYVDSLDHRMNLARAFLKLCSGRYGYFIHCGEDNLIPFLVSLPPSMELLGLLYLVNPDYIFGSEPPIRSVLPWLKALPSAPPEFINLWEDYAFMADFVEALGSGERPDTTFSPELLPILVGILLSFYSWDMSLRHLRAVLGITWEKLREIICSSRPNVAGDKTILRDHFVDVSFSETHPWPTVASDLARRYIRLIKSDAAGDLPDEINIRILIGDLVFLIRASPPCLKLYRDLWTIGHLFPLPGFTTSYIIYHVSKWLESFSDPTLDLIAFWRQCMSSAEKADNVVDYSFKNAPTWEHNWRRIIQNLAHVFPSTEHPSYPVPI
ncbi:NACHT domain-containing protein [Mycena venus]|uniref:NACHT domain-containing protein n=1 Tax=Mycena venus TaxID=2733690 RepID=A0A8H6Y7N9_9AGAR|nr:NACHT domain-containing protein [Mycena venus]